MSKLTLKGTSMTPEQLDRLGQLVDTVDNALIWDSNNFATDEIRLRGFRAGLQTVRSEVLALYLELGGTDEWAGRDSN